MMTKLRIVAFSFLRFFMAADLDMAERMHSLVKANASELLAEGIDSHG